MRKLLLLITALILSIFTLSSMVAFAEPVGNEPGSENGPEIVSLTDLGSPSITHWGGSYYSDGTLYYQDASDTVGFYKDHSQSIIEFDIIFYSVDWPAWISFNLRANEASQQWNCGGFSFFMQGAGIGVQRAGQEITTSIPNFTLGEKYRFQMGAYDEGNQTRLYLSVNGNELINVLDDTKHTGNYFVITGTQGGKAKISTTKREIVPNHHTYTLSTLGEFPTYTDPTYSDGNWYEGVSVDDYNNFTLRGGTIGWRQGLKNYSLEVKMNWDSFGPGENVYVGLRAPTFDRPSSTASGYRIRIGMFGDVEIYKEGTYLAGGRWGYAPNTDYVFEFGVVDLDENRTKIFVNLNGNTVVSAIDNDNPIRQGQWINFNGDGAAVVANVSSVSTRLIPLRTKVTESQDDYVIETFFKNVISHKDMSHDDFTSVMLDAISLNENTVNEINSVYYSMGDGKENAVKVETIGNKLVIRVAKTMYKHVGDTEQNFVFNELYVKKSGTETGLVCPSGYHLTQNYLYKIG